MTISVNRRVVPFRMLFSALIALSVSACGFITSGPRPEIHTFLLNGEKPSETLPIVSGRVSTGTLLVSVPRAKAGFRTQRMAYSVREHEVRYFALNQWADTPSRMLLPSLVESLERTKIWRTVVQMPSTIRGDFRLDTENVEVQQEFFQQPSRVRLTLRMQLTGLRDHRSMGTREFTVLEDAPSDDPYGGVVAANRAVAKLLEGVSDWLATCMLEPKPGKC